MCVRMYVNVCVYTCMHVSHIACVLAHISVEGNEIKGAVHYLSIRFRLAEKGTQPSQPESIDHTQQLGHVMQLPNLPTRE